MRGESKVELRGARAGPLTRASRGSSRTHRSSLGQLFTRFAAGLGLLHSPPRLSLLAAGGSREESTATRAVFLGRSRPRPGGWFRSTTTACAGLTAQPGPTAQPPQLAGPCFQAHAVGTEAAAVVEGVAARVSHAQRGQASLHAASTPPDAVLPPVPEAFVDPGTPPPLTPCASPAGGRTGTAGSAGKPGQGGLGSDTLGHKYVLDKLRAAIEKLREQVGWGREWG